MTQAVAMLFLVLLYTAPLVLVGLHVLRGETRPMPVAGSPPLNLPDRLPRGYGLARVWRQYVRAVLDVRLSRPEDAREMAESVRTTGRLPLATGRLQQAEQTLWRTVMAAGQPELAAALRSRAWAAAIRLWVVRGYPW